MDTYEIVAQAVGLVAMAFNIISYQGKKQSTVILLQLFGGTLFAVNYLMLGATVGGVLNIIGAVRAIVFLFKDRLKTDRLPWLIGFVASYLVIYVLNFMVFGKEVNARNLIIEILPVIGMVSLTIGYRLKKAGDVRKFGLISSPAWLTYNIIVGSWGATLCKVITLGSILLGMFRYDRAKE